MTVGTARIHDSAPLHVSGQAQYCDDIVLPENALHAAFGMSPIAHGRITALDLSAVVPHPASRGRGGGRRSGRKQLWRRGAR